MAAFLMEKSIKYRLILQKAYFDKGLSVTNYVKYLIAFFGLASSDVFWTFVIAGIYAIACYVIGRIWFRYKLMDAELEVQNKANPFVKQMRKKFI